MKPLENNFPPIKIEDDTWRNGTAIWVLGCYHYDAEELPRVSQFNQCSIERLVHAANLYRQIKMPIYLTGGSFNPFSDYSHASQASLFLQELGVAKGDIILFEEGKNTAEEAELIIQHHKSGRLLIVTSASHTQRVSNLMSSKYSNILLVPVHFATRGDNRFLLNFPSTTAMRRSERALYEYAALLRDFLTS